MLKTLVAMLFSICVLVSAHYLNEYGVRRDLDYRHDEIPFANDRRDVEYGWPIVTRTETQISLKFPSGREAVNHMVATPVLRNRWKPDQLNMLFGFGIAFLTAVSLTRKPFNGFQLRFNLRTLLFATTLTATFFGLSDFEFHGWQWLLWFPIAFGVSCAVFVIGDFFLFLIRTVFGMEKERPDGTMVESN